MDTKSTFGEAPARVIEDLRREFESLVGRFVAKSSPEGPSLGLLYPPVDVAEVEGGFELVADLPGLSADAIDLEYTADGLRLSGTRAPLADEPGRTLHRVERTTGPFDRTISLPGGADPERIEATYRDGTLTITVAKHPAEQPRKVPVMGGVPVAAEAGVGEGY